jgi:hypothetical protein
MRCFMIAEVLSCVFIALKITTMCALHYETERVGQCVRA